MMRNIGRLGNAHLWALVALGRFPVAVTRAGVSGPPVGARRKSKVVGQSEPGGCIERDANVERS